MEELEDFPRVSVWTDPVDDKDNYRCPHRLAYEAPFTVNKLFRYYRHYLDGFLPFDGGITEQPHMLVESFHEISTIRALLDKEDVEKSQSGNNSNSNGFRSVLSEK